MHIALFQTRMYHWSHFQSIAVGQYSFTQAYVNTLTRKNLLKVEDFQTGVVSLKSKMNPQVSQPGRTSRI